MSIADMHRAPNFDPYPGKKETFAFYSVRWYENPQRGSWHGSGKIPSNVTP
jgi:hypothetical protein